MQFNRGDSITRKAGVDLSAKQFFGVYIDTSGLVQLANAQTAPVMGILQNAPKAGDNANVLLLGAGGTAKVIVAAAITLGKYVTCDSAGKFIETTTNGDMVAGRTLKASAADGDTIEVMLLGFRY